MNMACLRNHTAPKDRQKCPEQSTSPSSTSTSPRTLYETHGLCSAHFRNALQDAATRLNALTGSDLSIAVTPYDIRGGHYPDFRHLRKTQTPVSENSIDAILITGGAPGVYEIDERHWMRKLAMFPQTVFREYPAVRIMGTCFGHQLIGHALVDSGAGDVYVEKCPLGREVGIHTVQLNREFIDAFPLALGGLPDGLLKIQLFHGDRVMVKGTVSGNTPETATVSLPPPWMNIGSTPICLIQGMYYPGRVLSVQGHYELDRSGCKRCVWSLRRCWAGRTRSWGCFWSRSGLIMGGVMIQGRLLWPWFAFWLENREIKVLN